jgi:hypothetical protein
VCSTSDAEPAATPSICGEQGHDVIGIDNSPGAIKVAKARGLRKAYVRSVSEMSKFRPESFDTVLMMGNNFGLVGSRRNAPRFFRDLSRITTEDAVLIVGTRNPYGTSNPLHLGYHRLNRKRGRMAGQLRIRVRYEAAIGPWLDYLLVSPDEMNELLRETDWNVKKIFGNTNENYFAVIAKRLSKARR